MIQMEKNYTSTMIEMRNYNITLIQIDILHLDNDLNRYILPRQGFKSTNFTKIRIQINKLHQDKDSNQQT